MRTPAGVWRDLRIGRKALVVIAIPVLPLIFTAGLYLLSSAVSDRASDSTARAWDARVTHARLYALVLEAESTIRGYLLGGDSSLLERHKAVRTEIEALLQRLEAAPPESRRQTSAIARFEDEQRARLARLRELIGVRLEALDAVLRSNTTTGLNSPEMLVHVARGAAAMRDLRAEMESMAEGQAALLTTRTERLREARAQADDIVRIGAGLGVVGGLAAAWLFTAGVARRLKVTTENMTRLSEHQPLLPAVAARDEIGQLTADTARAAALLAEREAQLKLRMEELEGLTKELEAFSYSVSHDLRAPLRHVAGFAAMLEKSAGDTLSAQQQRYVRTIVGAAAHMGRLIDDLLAFSRTSRAELQLAPVDVAAVVHDVQQRITGAINGRQVDWAIHPLPQVQADRAMLRVIVDNLLSNAVKYTGQRERAEIEVGATTSDGETVIYVRDNGVGFDMKYQDKLFGVFQRLHSSDEFEGTGIGLATVRRIVARHGGRVWAEGRPGEGATFYVALPATETAA